MSVIKIKKKYIFINIIVMINFKVLLAGIIILILIISIIINCILLLNKSSKTFSPGSSAPPAPIKGHPTVWTISKSNENGNDDGIILYSNNQDLIGSSTNDVIGLVWNKSNPTTEDNEFSKQRYCFMFLPGTYNGVTVKMNYYTTFYGLSNNPNQIIFQNSYILNPTFGSTMPGSLDNFWRSIENINFSSTTVENPEDKISGYHYIYSVSQAAPLRNCIFNADLNLFTYLGGGAAAFSSGGYMSNIKCNGNIDCGSQQQFCFNNVELQQRKLNQAVWNTVLINCKNTPQMSTKETFSYNNVTQTNYFKPIMTIDKHINHTIYTFNSSSAQGFIDLSYSKNLNTIIKDTEILIINNVDDFDNINNYKYKAAIVYPGFYELKTPIIINNDYFVFFTLGLPGIQCPNENSAIIIKADNVIVAGGLYESNPYSNVINVINILGKNCKLFDIFIRTTIDNVCSSQSNITDAMIVVNNDSCFIDNTWLWRADHLSINIHNGLGSNYCKSNNGLNVKPNGTKCVINGLFTEHHLEKLLQWDGADGQVNFLQSEIPYDLTTSKARNYIPAIINGDNFNGIGMGIYCYFIDKFWNSTRGQSKLTSNDLPIVPYAFKFNTTDYTFKYIFAKILENHCSAGGFYKLTNNDPLLPPSPPSGYSPSPPSGYSPSPSPGSPPSDYKPFYSFPNQYCERINQRMYENNQHDTNRSFTNETCDAIQCINGKGQNCSSEEVC
jgi:hypothetical protein